MTKQLLLLVFSFLTINGYAQKQITNEDLWRDYTFYAKSVPGFNFLNDGKHYTRLQDNVIKKYDLLTGDYVSDLLIGENLKGQEGFGGVISSFKYNHDESKIMIKSDSEAIYRRSTKAYFLVYDVA